MMDVLIQNIWMCFCKAEIGPHWPMQELERSINTGKMLISQGVALLFCREPIVSAHDLDHIAA